MELLGLYKLVIMNQKIALIACLFLFGCWQTAFSQGIQNDKIGVQRIGLSKAKADTAKVNVFLTLGKLYLDKPGNEKTNVDSAIYFVEQAEKLSNVKGYKIGYGRSVLGSALIAIKNKKNQEALQLTRKALKCFMEASDFLDIGETYILMGQRYDDRPASFERKIECFRNAADAFMKSGTVRRAGDAFKDIGENQLLAGKNKEALENLRTSLKLYESVHDKDLGSVYYLISRALSRTGDFVNELKYSLLAIKNIEASGDTSSPVLRNIFYATAMAYHRVLNYNTAHTYYVKARRLAYMQKDTSAMLEITFNMGMSYLFDHKFDEAVALIKCIGQLKDTVTMVEYGMYTAGELRRSNKSGQLEKALGLLNTLKKYKNVKLPVNIREKLASTSIHTCLDMNDVKGAETYFLELSHLSASKELALTDQLDALNGIIRYDNLTGQSKAAFRAVKAYQYLCKKNNLKIFNKEHENWLFKTDSLLGNYLSAIKHYQNYKRGEDSLLNESNSREISLLNIQYETQKKDKNILLKNKNIQMLARQSLLQRTTLRQEKVKRNLTIGVAIMLLIVSGIGYNRYRLKQESNLLLQSQQLEIDNQHKKLMTSAEDLTLLLKEKEWLLKEIHHRVKNNLQVTMSLLNMQSFYISNHQAQEAISNSRRRMYSISLIHQQLYQSEGLCYINIGSYIAELGGYLQDNISPDKKIRLILAIEHIEIDVAQAVPLGLLINEAMSNCFKHAFLIKEEGFISLQVYLNEKGNICLSISDDGCGIPENFMGDSGHTLGMNLMYGLSSQLGGDLSITVNQGTTVKIIFPPINSLEEELPDGSCHQGVAC